MTTKDVLNAIVTELEETGALVSTLQKALLSKDQLSESALHELFPKMREGYQRRLARLRVMIGELD
jgi:hypothetical protein